MDELVRINYENDRPTVLGRDLHAVLEVKTPYDKWFPRMCEYGFVEGTDFSTFLSESTGGRPAVDHQITIDMAKELCMIQRTPKGKQCRRYFLEIERRWNSPEAIMARALQFANQQLNQVRNQNKLLEGTIAVQNQQIAEMKPKVSYYDVVLNCKDLISTSAIAKDYGKSAIWMNRYLNKKGIPSKPGLTNFAAMPPIFFTSATNFFSIYFSSINTSHIKRLGTRKQLCPIFPIRARMRVCTGYTFFFFTIYK
jgi:anti-repressor protein